MDDGVPDMGTEALTVTDGDTAGVDDDDDVKDGLAATLTDTDIVREFVGAVLMLADMDDVGDIVGASVEVNEGKFVQPEGTLSGNKNCCAAALHGAAYSWKRPTHMWSASNSTTCAP